MSEDERSETTPRGTLPLSVAVIPSATLGLAAWLADASWPGLDRDGPGYLVLAFTAALPLFVLCVRSRSRTSRWAALAIAGASAVALALHGGLADHLVRDLDRGFGPTAPTIDAALGVLSTAVSIPLGLLAAERLRPSVLALWIVIGAAAGATGQLAWFTATRLISGPGGIELWMWARALIAACAGASAGLLVGSVRLHGLEERLAGALGVTDLAVRRLPRALPLSLLLACAVGAAGIARVLAESSRPDRFVTTRLDEHAIALSNLHLARAAGMEYPQLAADLSRSKRAVLESAAFDPALPPLLRRMLDALADDRLGHGAAEELDEAVLAVNRAMLAAEVPYFLEPHEIEEGGRATRFTLRYRVVRHRSLPSRAGTTVDLLRLRRDDDLLVDTPFTGLSYPGIGTVLMDHIDDSALRVHGRLLSGAVREDIEADGKLAWTRTRLRLEKRGALIAALHRRGHVHGRSLERIAALGERWLHRIDVGGARAEMDATTLAAYDALADELARQTELHEARHALDGDLDIPLAQLDELGAGPLCASAVAEVRAHTSEIIEGPLGPRFATATIAQLLAGENARANAYLFASIVILEGLWGEPVRKPDTVVIDGVDGAVERAAPLSRGSPGWLSYSRINACCEALFALGDEELRARARALWRRLFGEEYPPIRGDLVRE